MCNYSVFNIGDGWGGQSTPHPGGQSTPHPGVQSTPHPGCFTPRKDPESIVEEVGLALGPVWTEAENSAPTGIQFRTV